MDTKKVSLVVAILAVVIALGAVFISLSINPDGSVKFGDVGTKLIEDYLSTYFHENSGYYSELDISTTGKLSVTGTSTATGGITIGEETEYFEAGTLALGDAQDCIVFNKASVGFFDRAESYINGTASTTLELNVATSSSATLGQDANPYAELIDSYLIATSTANKLVNSEENQGTNGVSAIPVTSSEYVCVGLTDPYQIDGTCTGVLCENSTSTNRGYTLNYKLKYHY